MIAHPAGDSVSRARSASARTKFLVSLLAAGAVAVVAWASGAGRAAPLIGWDVLAVVSCAWTWIVVWRLDARDTARHAQLESQGRDLTDVVLVGAATASVVSVFVSWTMVHTVFTTKYARLYYSGRPGGIDFNDTEPPDYRDFAYLAFTVGMTFQVSDTNIQSKQIRRTALRHALLSFPLGTVIIASAINLVAGLAA